MLGKSRAQFFIVSVLWLSLQSSCGDATAVSNPQAVGENHCTEKAPLDDAPVTYCKTLEDGSVHSVQLKGSTYVQDFETCVITVVDDGVKSSILEMGFAPCE